MCEACNSFKEFYDTIDSGLLLEDMLATKLLNNTGEVQKYRGEFETKIRYNQIFELEDKNIEGERLEYISKSTPSFEEKQHNGYIEYYYENGKLMIHRVFCDCLFYNFTCYYANVKKDIATWNIPAKYIKRELSRGKIKRHNKEKNVTTNKNNTPKICKHLYQIISNGNYIPLTVAVKIIEPKKPKIILPPVKSEEPPKTTKEKLSDKNIKVVPKKEEPIEKEPIPKPEVKATKGITRPSKPSILTPIPNKIEKRTAIIPNKI